MRRCLQGAAGVLVAASAAGAAEAAPPWSEPRSVAAQLGQVGAPTLGFGTPNGALISWTANPGIPRARTGFANLTPRGTLVLQPSSGGALATRPEVDGRGRAVLLRRRAIVRRTATSAQRYRLEAWFGVPPSGPSKTIANYRGAAVEGEGVDADANASGRVAAAWVEHHGRGDAEGIRVRVALGDVNRGYRRPRTLATGGLPTRDSGAVGVAYADNGDLVVVYSTTRREGRRDRPVVAARVRPRGGSFGPVQVLGRRQPLTELTVAPARNGRTLVAWGSQDSGEEAGRPWVVRAAVRPPRRVRFGRAQLLDPGETAERIPGRVALAVAANGRAVLAWSNARGGGRSFTYPVSAATTGTTGGFGPVIQLAENGAAGAAAMSARGDAVVVWSSLVPEVDPFESQLYTAVRPRGAPGFGLPEAVSSPGAGAGGADIAYDPRTGRPTAVWQSDAAAGEILLAARTG